MKFRWHNKEKTHKISQKNSSFKLTMNYNRRRNIFTLGDFHQYSNPTQQIKAQHNRRQNSDPFERDPFKVQSYNFRYAERPTYPLPNLGNRAHTTHQPSTSSTSSRNKGFETFFYNYDFASSVHDKENPPANKFREFRRRKFILDHQQQNPTAASMYAQAATSRQASTLQYHQNLYQQQQQLHALSNASYGRSASQTAFETTLASAAAAASECARANDNNRRKHQAFGSATTDTSSIATTPRISSSQQKYGQPTSARSTGNREYLRALAAAHIGATAANNQQPNYLGRGRCSSRSSLERGRRRRAEPLGCYGSGSIAERDSNNNTFNSTHGNATNDGYIELSSSRASPSKYAATRQRLQATHTASPHRVTATVEKTEGTCSGCQININIKGLDTTQLGDNVVIKIESDKNTPVRSSSRTEQFPAVISTLNNIYNGVGGNAQQQKQRGGSEIAYAKLVEIKRNSEVNQNLDIKPNGSTHHLPPQAARSSSSANFVIDKRLSKFAMTSNSNDREQRKLKPRSSSHSRIPVTSSNTRAMGLTSSTTALRCTNSSENIQRNTRTASKERITKTTSKERMPSMVPWCLDTTIRRGFGSNDDIKSLRAQSSNLIKQLRPSYEATLNDVRQKRRQAALAAYKPLSLQRTTTNASTPKTRKLDSFDGAASSGARDRKLSESKSLGVGAAAAAFLNGNALKRRQSHHSLRSLKSASKSTLQSQSNSQYDLGNSPTIIMRRSRSCIRTEELGATRNAADSQSHLSAKTTPLNVNINVFADKLRLLRV
ncbi:pneumococcal serine-rich repeat protein [Eurosta solidaginis]|uniref:pneumococcal serine-rich repeat protein n=1 Tax=Eurosta solidaginis TaxID=178769 RepID=UPI00353102DE